MRPIIRRSAQLRDREVRKAEASDIPANLPRARVRQSAATRDKTELSKRHASIPSAINTAYNVAPISRINIDTVAAPKTNSKFKGMKARLDASKAELRRM